MDKQVIIVVAVVVFLVAGWNVYNSYTTSPKSTPPDSPAIEASSSGVIDNTEYSPIPNE